MGWDTAEVSSRQDTHTVTVNGRKESGKIWVRKGNEDKDVSQCKRRSRQASGKGKGQMSVKAPPSHVTGTEGPRCREQNWTPGGKSAQWDKGEATATKRKGR